MSTTPEGDTQVLLVRRELRLFKYYSEGLVASPGVRSNNAGKEKKTLRLFHL